MSRNIEEFRKATEGKTIDDFVEKVKLLPLFDMYKMAVEEGKQDTARMLEMTTMLVAMGDKELSALMTHVAMELLFAVTDQKLKEEILGGNDGN